MSKIDYQTHVTILAWINIGFSVLISFIGIFGFFFLSGLGALVDDPEAAPMVAFVGFAGAGFLILLSLPGYFAGYGLLQRRRWGRFLAIVVAVIDLFEIPIGTAVGAYGLWVLTAEEAGAYFAEPVTAATG